MSSVSHNQADAVKIESHVPMPPKRGRCDRKLTLCRMKVGDSILIPHIDIKKWQGAATQYKAKHVDFNYTTRRVDDDSYRMWRILKEDDHG